MALFDGFSLSARALSIIPATYEHVQYYRAGKVIDTELDTIGLAIYYIIVFSPILPPLLLWYFTSRRANVIAKWLLIAFVAYEVIALTLNALAPEPTFADYKLLLASVAIFDCVAIVMLNWSDSRVWFKRRSRFGKVDPDIFD